ncbi:low affinity iron permease family protein [Frondihabitans peucedani]|uniref:low affinity iron permease family protein n=1 Tax=Frondihabitans peucedani TaxID=598626 RepID=UPI0031D2725F
MTSPDAPPSPSTADRVRHPRWRRGLINARQTRTASGRRWSSRVLHRVNEATAHSTTGVVAALAILGWVVYGFVAAFPAWWDNVLYITSSTITLLMVFAIQHTQARQQTAVQRKLDEILHALPHADDRLIAVEEAPDAELEALATLDLLEREEAVQTRGALEHCADPHG